MPSLFGSSTLGEVLVAVGVDTKQLTTGLEKAKVETQSAGTGLAKFGQYAQAAYLVAGAAAIAFAKSAAEAAMKHEEVVSQLTQTLGYNTDALQKQAAALTDTTGYTEDATLAAEKALAPLHLTQQQYQQLIPLVQDYARFTGKDLATAGAAVEKAVLGNGRALKEVGIRFKDTGDNAQNLDIIMQGLQTTVGGTAEEFGTTTAGALQIASAEFENLKVQLGTALLPIIKEVATALSDTITVIQGFIHYIHDSGSSLGFLADLATKTLNPLHYMFQELHLVATAIRSSSGATDEQKVAFDQLNPKTQAVAGALDHVASTFDNVKQKAIAARKAAKQAIDDTTTSLTLQMTSLQGVKKGWDLTSEGAVRGAQTVAQKQRTIANDLDKLNHMDISKNLKTQMENLGPDMVHAFVTGNAGQQQKILAALKVYNTAVKRTHDEVVKTATQLGDDMMTGTIQGITQNAPQLAEAVRQAVLKAIKKGQEAAQTGSASKVMRRLGDDMMLGLQQGIENGTSTLLSSVRSAIDKLVQQVRDRLSNLRSRASEYMGGIASGIKGPSLFEGIGGLFGQTDAEGNAIPVTSGEIGGQIASQVLQAQAFARQLRQLAKQGLSKQLLAQLASQGAAAGGQEAAALLADPELIKQMNQAQQALAKAAGTTADQLGDRFFGEAIRNAKERLDRLTDALAKLRNEVERQPGGITVILNVAGSVLTDRELMDLVRQAAQQGKQRNGGNTGFS